MTASMPCPKCGSPLDPAALLIATGGLIGFVGGFRLGALSKLDRTRDQMTEQAKRDARRQMRRWTDEGTIDREIL